MEEHPSLPAAGHFHADFCLLDCLRHGLQVLAPKLHALHNIAQAHVAQCLPYLLGPRRTGLPSHVSLPFLIKFVTMRYLPLQTLLSAAQWITFGLGAALSTSSVSKK